ncbi:hypothetical protein ACQUFY_16720 [Robbsia andropogonis]|uniref:hypothetical protein n=1 Tax=Robbsia andropogonis TaxID=28092 RepID=UPI003D1C66F8
MAMIKTGRMPGAALVRAAATTMLAAMTLAGLGACSSGPALFTSDGRPTQQISCNGGSFVECQRRAQVACGDGGYDTLSQQTGQQNTMVIACKRIQRSY